MLFDHYIEQVKFLMLYLYKWKQVAYDCQCGHMRPWAPHLRLPLTKLVREEIHKRQASKQCEMVKKTVKKDPATGSQKTQVSKSQWYKLKFKCVSILFNAFDLAVNLTRHLGQVGPHAFFSCLSIAIRAVCCKRTYPSYGYPIAVSD